MGGRGSKSGMSRNTSSGSIQSGIIGNNHNIKSFADAPAGAHSNAIGTTYFGAGTSKQQLLDFADNSPYISSKFGNYDVKGLGVDVVGNILSPDYPSGNVLTAHALVFSMPDGTFSLDYTRPSGSTTDRTYKSEASAMKAGRAAIKKFIEANYGKK